MYTVTATVRESILFGGLRPSHRPETSFVLAGHYTYEVLRQRIILVHIVHHAKRRARIFRIALETHPEPSPVVLQNVPALIRADCCSVSIALYTGMSAPRE